MAFLPHTKKLFSLEFYRWVFKYSFAFGMHVRLHHHIKYNVKNELVRTFKRYTVCLVKGHTYEESINWGRLDVWCTTCSLRHRNHYSPQKYPDTNGYEIPIEEWKSRFPTVYKRIRM